jgi:hypothetical protein
MSRVLTVRVCDSSGKDLLGATELVDVPLESTFRDVWNDLPGDFADRTLLEVFVREYEGAPDRSLLRLRAGFLEKSLAEIDLILQQHRKLCPGHATLSVSLRQAPGPAEPVVQNAFTLLAAAGQAAYCRKKTVQLHEVQCWFQSSTDKGQLAAALQTRLEHVGAGFLSSDNDTLRRLVFTRLVQVFWRVTPQLQKSAALPPGGANQRKRGRPPLAKRACPAGNVGRASVHGPGTSVYDEVQAACDSGLYTWGAVLMPAGHALDPATYCNVALTCAAPVESILYNMGASAMNQPLLHFSKGLCSVCGIEQVSGEELKEQGCSGNDAKKWAACPLCVGCAAQGFKASSVRKTRMQSKRVVRGQERAHAVPAPRPAAAHKGASEALSDYSE